MIVNALIQRLPRAESASLSVASVEEAEELVLWTKNDRFTFQGVTDDGAFLFRYYEPAASWYWEIRSDQGCYMVRREPATYPENSAELSWPENYVQEWESVSTSPLTAQAK